MSNAFTLFLTAFFSFSAFILSIIGCAGSTKNYYPINHIYTSQIDLTDISIRSVISTATIASTSDISLPGYINLGLWSYCIETTNKTVTSCTSPKGIQKFNLKELLYDNIENNSILEAIDSASMLLPEDIQNKEPYFNGLIKCMFITLLIGIVLSFLNTLVCIIRWIIHFGFIQAVGIFISFFSFASLLVSASSCVAALITIYRILDNNDSYGIKLNYGHVYLGIIWGGVLAALFNFITWCSVRSSRRPQIVYMPEPIEKKPLIY